MSRQKNWVPGLLALLAVSLISISFTAAMTADYDRRQQFQVLEQICENILEEEPKAAPQLLAALKACKQSPQKQPESAFLTEHGYEASDFFSGTFGYLPYAAGAGVLIGIFFFLLAFWHLYRRNQSSIRTLTQYLEKVNTGSPGTLLMPVENRFSGLQDEIYKTVTALKQTGEEALRAKENYGENLANIAHQLKTPITAISLSVQMLEERYVPEYVSSISQQLDRLTHLEEALLLLSRIDAGSLSLEKRPVDVFTVLTLAADHLEPLFLEAGVSIEIPEMGEVQILGDMDWTMEALMNLMKNCMEHTPPGGRVHCAYEQNPLYTKIRIWDEGQGFEKEDLPHLFDRFYCGKNAKSGSIGIGLSLAKAILEMQNGVIQGENLPAGGACFEIRIYCH